LYEIIPYKREYRDDLLFCLLSAKDALGKVPTINEDLLDIQRNYIDNNDMFWIAVDGNKRVVGMLGTKTDSPTDLWLKRFYIKPELKCMGIGSALLSKAEKFAKQRGIETIHTRFSDDYVEAAVFYPSKGFIEHDKSDGLTHLIKTVQNSM